MGAETWFLPSTEVGLRYEVVPYVLSKKLED